MHQDRGVECDTNALKIRRSDTTTINTWKKMTPRAAENFRDSKTRTVKEVFFILSQSIQCQAQVAKIERSFYKETIKALL